MKTRNVLCGVVLALGALPAFGQDDNVPPEIQGITFEIARYAGGTDFFPNFTLDPSVDPGLFGRLPYVPFNPNTDIANELDVLRLTINVFDPDFSDGDMSAEGESVFYLVSMFWVPVFGYLTPEPPPVAQATPQFFPPGDDDGLRPGMGTLLTFQYLIEIPQFQGKNQARLRGLINFDVQWLFRFVVSNNQSPCTVDPEGQLLDCMEPFDTFLTFIVAAENPVLAPPNPKAFADAGADQTVAAGRRVTLDGSRTFDSFNVGFNSSSGNVFEKDEIEFAWEWLSGPVRVDPEQSSPTDPVARVTLTQVGQYEFRLLADDQFNPVPTSDTVVITVVEDLPVNEPPVAVVRGPARPVGLGLTVTLDATESTDPDGDELTYRWTQTDELGDVLPLEEVQDKFQPLGGLTEPIVRWQANIPGMFHFRLLVSDGEFQSSTTFSVEVLDSASAGVVFDARNFAPPATQEDTSSGVGNGGTSPGGFMPLCGAGLSSLLAAPLLLGALRRRF